MYPERELSRLAARKALLQLEIALRREQCARAAASVARPLEWLDRALGLWRRFSPLAQLAIVPLGLLVRRKVFRRHRLLGSIVRWGPLVAGVVRGFGSAARARPGASGKD